MEDVEKNDNSSDSAWTRICWQCMGQIHRNISILEDRTVNLLAYGCERGACDSSLRKRFDDYTNATILKYREEKNKSQNADD